MSDKRNDDKSGEVTPETAPTGASVRIDDRSGRGFGYASIFKALGFLVVVVAVLFTLIQWFYGDDKGGQGSLPGAPHGVRSVTLDPGEKRYQELLKKKNEVEFQAVVEKGGSVIPPPIGKPVAAPPPPPPVVRPPAPPPPPPPPPKKPVTRHRRLLHPDLLKQIDAALRLIPHENVVILEGDPGALNVAPEDRTPAGAPSPTDAAGSEAAAAPTWLIAPGQVLYGSFDTAVNSDYRVPILRVTLAGPKMQGWRLLGGYRQVGDKMVIRFNSLIAPSGKLYPVEAYAVDPKTALPAMADGVDYHWVRRYVLRFAGLFLQGVGQAASQPNTRIDTVSSGAVSTITGGLGMADQIKMGLGRIGEAIGRDMERFSQRPPTIWIDPGTPLGVIFVTPVTERTEPSGRIGSAS